MKVPPAVPERAGEMWSLDFMSDVLVNKIKFRTLIVIDGYNRQAITVEAANNMPTMRVTQILERTIEEQGKPECIRVDNGLSLSVKSSRIGVRRKESQLDIHNRENLCKMAISKGSTGLSERMYLMPIYSKTSARYSN